MDSFKGGGKYEVKEVDDGTNAFLVAHPGGSRGGDCAVGMWW